MMMKQYFTFELQKMKKNSLIILSIAVFVQLLSIYFFTLVGRIDSSTDDLILKNYSGLIALGTTVTLSVLTIYGAIVANRMIVVNYIGDSRIRLYLYPYGKSPLYYCKNSTFAILFFVVQFSGTLIANGIYLLTEMRFPISTSSIPIYSYWKEVITIPLIATVLTVAMILLSGIIGIMFRSLVATIIAGVIFITCFGNIVARSFMNSTLLILIGTLLIFIIALLMIKLMGNRIDREDVL